MNILKIMIREDKNMELLMLKDSVIATLKRNIDMNAKKYNDSVPFIDEYFSNQDGEYFVRTGIIVEECELLDGIENDAKNAMRLYESMKKLLPIHAREEKIWSYLTHKVYWKYMLSRWNGNKIKPRYFFENDNRNKILSGTRQYVRNGISRLWWGAYIVYDERLSNPYEYIEDLFASQDLFVGICERDLGKNKDLVISILKNVRNHNILKIKNSNDIIRKLLKDIRFSGGLIMYETLSQEAIDIIIEKRILKLLDNLIRV